MFNKWDGREFHKMEEGELIVHCKQIQTCLERGRCQRAPANTFKREEKCLSSFATGRRSLAVMNNDKTKTSLIEDDDVANQSPEP